MKKVYVLFALIVMSAVVFAQNKKAVLSVSKVVNAPKMEMATSGAKLADTDTLTNMLPNDSLAIYTLTGQWGYFPGHNGYLIPEYAEKFTNSIPGEINGVIFSVGIAYAASPNATVTFKVYADGNTPGAALATKSVPINTLIAQQYNEVVFDNPVAVTGNFYVGYEITYNNPVDTFATFIAQFGNTSRTVNTMYTKYNNTWYSVENLFQSAPKTAMDFYVRFAANVSQNPQASVNPTSYNFGTVQTGSTNTSTTFTLTNIGGSNLTVSAINGLSGTPFTCSLNPSSVNLGTGQNVTFTFNFNPTADGSFNATATIVTNGGNVDITLTGQAVSCATINTFPWVESFEGGTFPPACWTKASPDNGTGWDVISAGTTPLPGWQGGTMSVPANGGNNAAFCTWTTGGTTSNNQWLITPQIAVQANHELSFYMFWFGAYQDYIDVKVSTTTNDVASFTTTLLSLDTTQLIHNDWKLFTINLGNYTGQNVYFAFNEHVADNYNDGAFIAVDLVRVGEPLSVTPQTIDLVSIFPNPANDKLYITSKDVKTVQIYNINGQMVAEYYNQNIVNVANLEQGVYVVKVVTNNKVVTQKINIVR